MFVWSQEAQPPPGAQAGGPAGSSQGSPRHTVLLPPAGAPDAPQEAVALPETTLVDVLLCDHRHTLTLFNHFTLAVAQGNTHAMELLAGALALDVRLHSQAVLDVLVPLLGRRYCTAGAELAGSIQQQLQRMERHMLEMLTFRREADWAALARRADLAHKDFSAHVHDVEVEVLPRLAADLRQEELASSGLLFQQQKQTASLVPQLGAAAFNAAAAVGPEAATVLGGPLVAGEYQQHTHHAYDAHHAAAQGAGEVGTAGTAQQPLGSFQYMQSQSQYQQWQESQQEQHLPIAMPDKIVTPSQQYY